MNKRISNFRMFIFDGYHGNISSYLISPISSNTLYSLACVWKKQSYNNRILEFFGNLPMLPPLSDLMIKIIVVTIATVHLILLKPFLRTQSMYLGQNNIDMWQKT